MKENVKLKTPCAKNCFQTVIECIIAITSYSQECSDYAASKLLTKCSDITRSNLKNMFCGSGYSFRKIVLVFVVRFIAIWWNLEISFTVLWWVNCNASFILVN